jgi:maleate isomerase
MAHASAGYGSRGRVAALVPRDNPTAEPELSALLVPDVLMMTTRMVSPAMMMADRLLDYGAAIDRWMEDFGDAAFDVVAFACTGTSYLQAAGAALPSYWCGREGRKAPIISAAQAVGQALETLGGRRISLVSPYPKDLQEAAASYWERRGFTVVAVESLTAPEKGHLIYAQSAGAMNDAISRASAWDVDAVLALGTGAPTLAAILRRAGGPAVLSSTLCMGWAIQSVLEGDAAPPFEAWLKPDALWRQRFRQRFPTAADGCGSMVWIDEEG